MTENYQQSGPTAAAKDEARDLAQSASGAGAQVAEKAREATAKVTAQAGREAKDLLAQARDEISSQVGGQQRRAAEGLRSLTGELTSMADSVEQPGMASDLARQAANRAESFATLLEREPTDLVQDLVSYARRRPGMFLAVAACAGFAVGRLTRGIKADQARTDDASSEARGSRDGDAAYGQSQGYGLSYGERDQHSRLPGGPYPTAPDIPERYTGQFPLPGETEGLR